MTDQKINEKIAIKKKKLLAKLLWLILFIFFINFFASFVFSWYWTIWWFDMFMHFLGGLWISLISLWIYFYLPASRFLPALKLRQTGRQTGSKLFERPRIQKKISIFLLSLLVVLIIGLLWEFFELSLETIITFADLGNLRDTLSDLLFDLIGGTAGALYFLFRKLEKSE